MGGLLGILTGPVKGLLDGVGGIVGKFVTTDKEKMELQVQLIKVQSDFESALADADQKFADSQASVIKAEVASESWLARNWRPILMLTFTYIIAHNFVIAPLFSLTLVAVPPQMWELLKIGMGGYIFGRSAEKIVPGVIAAVKNK